jgi:hypothetical protein
MLSGVTPCVWSNATPAAVERSIRRNKIAMLQNALIAVAGYSERDNSIKYAIMDNRSITYRKINKI